MESTGFLNLGFFFEEIYDVASGKYLPNGEWFASFLFAFLSFMRPFSLLFSLAFITGIVYSTIRINAILREAHEKTHRHTMAHGGEGEGAHAVTSGGTGAHLNPRWEKIMGHINSPNQSD